MRIVILGGFVDSVEMQLQSRFMSEMKEKSVVWTRQGKNATVDLHQLKTDLGSALSDGATDILLCLSINRRDALASYNLDAIIRRATGRFPDRTVAVQNYKSAFGGNDLLTKIEDFSPNREKQFSAVLEDLLPWAESTHSGKLIIHPRAARGVKSSAFSDVPLIYASLDLLAREYRNSKLSTSGQSQSASEALGARLQALGLVLSPSISETRAGEEGDDYFVEFPSGGGRKFLESHLKKGSAHDDRLCLRIYFFWSDICGCPVVGSMTAHLGTRQS